MKIFTHYFQLERLNKKTFSFFIIIFKCGGRIAFVDDNEDEDKIALIWALKKVAVEDDW